MLNELYMCLVKLYISLQNDIYSPFDKYGEDDGIKIQTSIYFNSYVHDKTTQMSQVICIWYFHMKYIYPSYIIIYTQFDIIHSHSIIFFFNAVRPQEPMSQPVDANWTPVPDPDATHPPRRQSLPSNQLAPRSCVAPRRLDGNYRLVVTATCWDIIWFANIWLSGKTHTRMYFMPNKIDHLTHWFLIG